MSSLTFYLIHPHLTILPLVIESRTSPHSLSSLLVYDNIGSWWICSTRVIRLYHGQGDRPMILILHDHCYPMHISLPLVSSSQQLWVTITSLNHSTLACFLNLLDLIQKMCTFISEFWKSCMMIKLQNLLHDAIKLPFIPFPLKDNANKWSITSRDKFVTIFLKEYYSMYMTTKLKNAINQFS